MPLNSETKPNIYWVDEKIHPHILYLNQNVEFCKVDSMWVLLLFLLLIEFLNVIFFQSFLGWDTKKKFMLNLTGLNAEFSFIQASYHANVKKHCFPYYRLIAGRFKYIPRVLERCES